MLIWSKKIVMKFRDLKISIDREKKQEISKIKLILNTTSQIFPKWMSTSAVLYWSYLIGQETT